MRYLLGGGDQQHLRKYLCDIWFQISLNQKTGVRQKQRSDNFPGQIAQVDPITNKQFKT